MTPAACGSFVAGVDRPRAGFFLTRGQVCAQSEQMIRLFDQRARAGLFYAEALEVLGAFFRRKRHEFGLNFRRYDNRRGTVVMRNVVADLCYPWIRVGIGKFFFGDIAREQASA